MFCVFKCNILLIRETCTLLNQPPTSTDCWTNERPSKQAKKRRTRYRNYLYSDTLRFPFLLLWFSSFVCICICCCFKRRWIQFGVTMPGGRRGLVAPQNTFLENIIRRSNSQRKYIRFSFLSFFCPVFTTQTLRIRLRNCKWLDQRSKTENKKKIQWICHQRWNERILY